MNEPWPRMCPSTQFAGLAPFGGTMRLSAWVMPAALSVIALALKSNRKRRIPVEVARVASAMAALLWARLVWGRVGPDRLGLDPRSLIPAPWPRPRAGH